MTYKSGNQLRRYRFTGQSRQDLGDFDWPMLAHSPIKSHQKDVRFGLFDACDPNYEGALTAAIMFDFDDISYPAGIGLMDAVEAVIGRREMYQVFTGNGFHIYIPLAEGFDDEEIPYYRDSYRDTADEIWEAHGLATGKVDKQVFKGTIYGRMPGGYNSKNGAIVRYVGATQGHRTTDLGEILEAADISLIKRDTMIASTMENTYNPAEFCGFIRYCVDNRDNLTYEIWLQAMLILGYSGDSETAHRISSGHPDYTEEEVNGFFGENSKKYLVNCQTIADDMAPITDGSCHSCPHYNTESCPSLVTGVIPTPSAKTGFHGVTKDGSISRHKVHTEDMVGHWINTNIGKIMREGNSLYRWADTHWDIINGISCGPKYFPHQVMKEIQSLAKHPPRTAKMLQEIMQTVVMGTDIPQADGIDWDNPKYINFTNGVYDLDEDILHNHLPDYHMLGMHDLAYDPEADCPEWRGWLDEVLDKDSAQLLQVFFGLALANVPSEQYQQFLWMEGVSGTGKSTVYKVLSDLIGKGRALFLEASAIHTKESGYPFDFRGKTALIFDDFKPPKSPGYANQWESFCTQFTTSFDVGIRIMQTNTFNFPPKCTLFFTSNGPPPITHDETGVLRRIRVIRFYKKPRHIDLGFRDKFAQEMPGIINWALDGLDIYRDNNGIPVGKEEQATKELLGDAIEDKFSKFLRTSLVYSEHNTVSATKLYNIFLARTGADEASISHKKFANEMMNRIPSHFRRPLSHFKIRRSSGIIYTNIDITKGGKK